MSKKLCKKHWKNIKKVIQNRCQNHKKTIQKPMRKKSLFLEAPPGKPGRPAGSGKSVLWQKAFIRGDRKTTKGRQPEGEEFREEHAERPTSTLQHASGAFGPGADILGPWPSRAWCGKRARASGTGLPPPSAPALGSLAGSSGSLGAPEARLWRAIRSSIYI